MTHLGSRVRAGVVRRLLPTVLRPRPGSNDLTRLGSAYGGWWVPLDILDDSSVCYLAGVGMDITFDLALIERVGCRAWGFDPTPRTREWIGGQTLDPRYTFVPRGVAGDAGTLRFYAPKNADHISHSVKNLQRTTSFFLGDVDTVAGLMDMLGHTRLDLLKLDIEGAEHDAIRTMLRDGIRPKVVCLELDQPAPVASARETVRSMRRAGYAVVKVEGLNVTFVHSAPD